MMIRIRLALVTALALTSLCASAQVVGSKSPGKWVAGNFAQIHTACLQAFQCIPGVNVLHGPDTKVVTTPNEGVTGVCNAAGGAADGCNSCSANPPTKPCEYWLEKK